MLTKASRTSPAPSRLRVAILCSRRAPGLAELVDHDGSRGRSYEMVACITTDPECVERNCLEAGGIPCLTHDIRAFYRASGARLGDLTLRCDYDRRTRDLLSRFRPELVVLCGYLHILSRPMLEAYPARLINVHDSDLTVTDLNGSPRYRGLHSVREAVFAGERETRSTIHLVTPEVDVGPLLLRSWAFPVHPLVQEARAWGAADILKAYAYAQREWMMRAAWGRLLARTVELFALDQIRVLDGRAVVAGRWGPEELVPGASFAASVGAVSHRAIGGT